MIEIAGLPITIRVTNGKFSFHHDSNNGDILIHSDTKGANWQGSESLRDFGATLPGTDPDEILSRFRSVASSSEFDARAGKWTFNADATVNQNVNEILQAFNRLKMPGKKAYCFFSWHISSYRDFDKMPLMARYVDWPPAQSLLDFEFGEEKQCQVDVMCKKVDMYRLFLSFDNAESAAELANLFKIKLEKRNE